MVEGETGTDLLVQPDVGDVVAGVVGEQQVYGAHGVRVQMRRPRPAQARTQPRPAHARDQLAAGAAAARQRRAHWRDAVCYRGTFKFI